MKPLMHHDALFKKFLSDITVARDFLEAHLPSHLRARCDFSTLAMESGSFIEDDLRSQCSDMLYSLKTTEGQTGYVYCLLEHQSRPEKMMAFRLLRYSVAAMQRHLEQGNERLPVVIPVLFYQGRTSPYPYSMHWLDCFASPELAESVYGQAFPLADITVIPDEEILTHGRVALLEIVQKHIRTRDMLELAENIAKLLNLQKIGPEQFRSLMHYIVEQGNTSDSAAFLQTIAVQTADYREDIMTIAEQLRQEGERKGIARGIEQGIEQGRSAERLEMARKLLANGVDRAIVKLSTGLSDSDIDELTQ